MFFINLIWKFELVRHYFGGNNTHRQQKNNFGEWLNEQKNKKIMVYYDVACR